jgi:putative transposase
MKKHHVSFPVPVMCEVLEVSPSGNYAWRERKSSPRAERSARICDSVRQPHVVSQGNDGSLKLVRELKQNAELETACRNTAAKAMREMGLKSRIHKRFVPTTTQVDPAKRPAPNTLDRDFMATVPNRKWISDTTDLHTAAGWV